MDISKKRASELQEQFIEEMEFHRLYGASAAYDELMKRGYTCEFHKRRVKK